MNFISNLVNSVKSLFTPAKPAPKISGFENVQNYAPSNPQQSLLNNLMKANTGQTYGPPTQSPQQLAYNNQTNQLNAMQQHLDPYIQQTNDTARKIHNYLVSIGGASSPQAPQGYTAIAQAASNPQYSSPVSPAMPSYNMGDISSGLSTISNLISQLHGLQHPVFTSNVNPTTINNSASSNYLSQIPQQPSLIQKQQQYGLM